MPPGRTQLHLTQLSLFCSAPPLRSRPSSSLRALSLSFLFGLVDPGLGVSGLSSPLAKAESLSSASSPHPPILLTNALFSLSFSPFASFLLHSRSTPSSSTQPALASPPQQPFSLLFFLLVPTRHYLFSLAFAASVSDS